MDSDRGRQEEHGGGGGHQHQQYSTSELMSSAKVVASAAQSGFGKESAGGMDKAKVADAAGDLVGGARQYGKLDDKGMGQYAEKAENYLHNYGGGGGGGGGQSEKPPESKPEGHSEGGGGGGVGGYMKMAQGFMNK